MRGGSQGLSTDREGQTSGAYKGGMREGAPGAEESNSGVRIGDTGTQNEGRRIPSKMDDQSRQGVGKN